MDPVFLHDNNGPIQEGEEPEIQGWYFWDETWAHYHGPFATKEAAHNSCVEYARQL